MFNVLKFNVAGLVRLRFGRSCGRRMDVYDDVSVNE